MAITGQGGFGSSGGGFGGSGNVAFNVLGLVGVDDRQALGALNNIMNAANLMATSATRMAEAAERAFQRYNRAGDETRRTTISLRGAFEALATASFVKTMEGVASSMTNAAQKMQGFQRTLVGVTGSATEARKVLKEVSDYADRTPVDTDQLKEAAVRFASLKQPIIENLDLSAKLSYLFGVDLPRASQTVAEANGGVIDSLRRLKVEFAFTADQAQKYGAVVAKGHVAIGRPGSETNDRLMKALRAFVADREVGLGGDLFGGPMGIGGALSNLRSGGFLLMAQMGQQVSPVIVGLAKAARSLLDTIRELPTPIVSLAAHFVLLLSGLAALVPIVTVLTGFFKLFGLVSGFGRALAMMAAAEGTAAGATTLLTASFGPLLAAFALATVAIALYQAHLEEVDKKTVEASKHMAEFHKESQGRLQAGGKSLTDKNLTVEDLRNAKFDGADASRIAKEYRSRAQVGEDGKYADQRIQDAKDELDKASGARERAERGGVVGSSRVQQEARDNEAMAKARFQASLDHWNKSAETLEKYAASNLLPNLQKMFEGIAALATGKVKKDPREYHEIMAEADRDAQERALNIPGSGRLSQAKRLQAQVTESEESIKAEREAQIKRTIRENGSISKEARARIESGERDDPEQWKAYIELRKRLIEVRKEGLEIGQKERDQAEKLAEVQHKDTYESRIQAIEAERQAYAKAYSERTISEEDYDEKVQELSLRRAQEDQKKIDAQRDMDVELAKLYGDDVRAVELSMEKKVQAWKQAGVKEVDIEKMKAQEILQVITERGVKEVQLEQKISDDKSAVRSKNASTKEAVLQERVARGENVGGELRSARTEEGEAQKKDVDAKAARQRKILQAQLKTAKDPLERRRIQGELDNLAGAAQAEKDSIDQNVGSRNRSEERAEAARTGEAAVGAESIKSAQYGVRNELLKEKLEAGGGDPAKIGKEMLDNIHKQYELNKQILEDKERLAEVGKTEAEKANLRNQLELDKLQLQETSLKAARDATAEIEKQNALQNKSKASFSFGTYSSYEDAMKADQADSDAMRAKFYAKKDSSLAKKVGFDLKARQATVFNDAVGAKAAGDEVVMPGKTGLEKTHERWTQINEAGKRADLKGRAHLQVTIQAKDANGRPFDQNVHEAQIPLSKSLAQDTRNPLGGSEGVG